MAKYELAQRARIDLSAIGRFTKKKWGEMQTERYLAQLEHDLELLASSPKLGRLAGTKQLPKLRKFESGSHVFFYEMTAESILVGRILHKKMLPSRYAFRRE